ncbi:helix-turn-helix domain-containing protein [Actinacidiphila oryziradicis]|uniref:RNA polymerase sigma factor 70 region 4 type 2 domain-containing protein n=1 Tax=Actinacidiphila oryziradicis TaxID=2571141 RepID=A0A4V6WJ63_9ACTN|nr:hypothetical protein [Actinacidiphila oryziradicis]TKA06369.1 hypothetical protein FCI23_31775 [Actinacidiphila oryziradicis]
MRSNSTGDPGTQNRDNAGSDAEDLPEDVQHGVDRVAELIDVGFKGTLWHQTASELYAYAFPPLLTAMRRTDKLVELTAKSATPLEMSDEERSTLHRSPPDRENLAIHTIDIAMESFPQVLEQGGYAPARHRGSGGRPARLTSFFYGRCGLVFPRVFYAWRTERTDRFLLHALRMPDGILAHALGQTGTEPVPEAVTELCDALTEMINTSKPRNRAVMRLTVNGWTQSEIADLLDIKAGDVENARYAFRRRSGPRCTAANCTYRPRSGPSGRG